MSSTTGWPPSDRSEAILLSAMIRMAPPGIRLGCRTIRAGDEHLLLAEERRAVTTRDSQARRASGAGRHVAHGLLADLGQQSVAIGREHRGLPIWPPGISGSIAHDQDVAVAAVAPIGSIASLGIDVESAEPLPDDIAALVATGQDEIGTSAGHLAGRALFASKEAVYKATYPLDSVILNYDDITVDLIRSCARTRTDHKLKLYCCLSPRVVVLAVLAGNQQP